MISLAGTDATRAVYVFVIGTGLISTIVSDVPCAAIFMAIALGIFDKLNIRPGSQFGKAVMMGIPIGSLIGGVGTPAGSSINLLGLTMIEQNGGARVPFLHWMAIGIPMIIILLPLAAWVLLKFYPAGDQDDRRDVGDIKRSAEQLGPFNTQGTEGDRDHAALMVVLWISSTWLPALDIFVVSILGACAMFLPGIGLFTLERSAERDRLGHAADDRRRHLARTSRRRATGLAKWLADTALGGMQDWSAMAVIAAISAFTVVIHLLLPINPVINAVMIPPIMVLGNAAGVNPALYALPVIFTASCAFLLPLDAVPLVTYSRGYYRMFDMFMPGLIISVFWVILMTALLMVIGPMVGLL